VGFDGKFYTFYGNAMAAPAALSESGVGKVIAVAEWLPNTVGREDEAFYQSFKARYPQPADDDVHMRMQVMVEMLAQALERSRTSAPHSSLNVAAVARALESASLTFYGHTATMRAADHQLQQPLVVGLMDRQGAAGVAHDVEGSGYGFRVIRSLGSKRVERPSTCAMQRPGPLE